MRIENDGLILTQAFPNLYCCDASVLPSSMGKPLVRIPASLSKRLGGHLNEKLA